jgi:predicted TPR repeat methyltransferase
MLYEQSGELDKAVEQLEIILEIDPEYPGIREYLDHLAKRRKPLKGSPAGVGGD